MDYSIRRAEFQDAASIAQVHVKSWQSTYAGIVPDVFLSAMDAAERTEGWQNQIASGLVTILVVEDGANIVGFCCGGPAREALGKFEGELYAIYLLQEYQGRGAGTSLTQEIALRLREAGMASMIVWVLEANPAVGFYTRIGATPVSRKLIEIGGVELAEVALGWPALDSLVGAAKSGTAL